MMTAVLPYPKYKESGSQWLDEIPEHWRVQSLGSLTRARSERGRPDLPLLSVVREKGVVLRSSMTAEENRNFIPEDLSNYKVVRAGDLVINKMKAWQGSLGLAPVDGIVSPAYFVFDFSIDHRRFGQALLRSRPYIALLGRVSDGVRIGQWDLSVDGMRRIPVVLPPADEQVAIDRFLTKLDSLVLEYSRQKQRLIGLIEERRRGVIDGVLRRGLDSAAPTTDSGVSWLGHVPSHWKVVPLKLELGFQEGPGIMAEDFREEGVPLLRISCLSGPDATLDGCDFLDPEMVKKRWAHFRVRSDDYLLSASGSLGSVCRANDLVAGAIPYTGILRLWARNPTIFSMEFARYFMASEIFRAQVNFMKTGVGIEHFGPSHLKRMLLTLPPRDEQDAMVEKLTHATRALERGKRAALSQIASIREYRMRLAADVVTGRLDVRKAAATLPDPESDNIPVVEASPDEVDDLDPDLVEAEA